MSASKMSGRGVAVIGAGIAGLLAAYNLNDEVTIFEAARPGSRGRRCAGIVSIATLFKLPGARSFVEQFYTTLELAVPELSVRVSASAKEPFACKLNRPAYEEELAGTLEGKGVKLVLRTPVRAVEPSTGGVRVWWSGGGRLYEAAILAEGYPPVLSRRLGLAPPVEARVGAHVRARASHLNPSSLHVIYSPKVLEGFAWLAPIDERNCSLGVVTKRGRSALETLKLAEGLYRRLMGVDVEPRGGLRGGYVLRGYPRVIKRGRVFVFGDAAAMVKSLSGGGLYAISSLARPLASLVNFVVEGVKPERSDFAEARSVLSALRRSFVLAERIDRAISSTPRLGLKLEVEVLKLEYDDHALALLQMILGVRLVRSARGLR